MILSFSARRLEQEVDAIICGALRAGHGAAINVHLPGEFKKDFAIDRILVDDDGYPSEVWLSASAPRSFWDVLTGVHKRDLLRVARVGGDVRCGLSRVIVMRDGSVKHVSYKEEVGAPRISRSVATFSYPRPDATDWLQTYARAS